MLSNALFDKHNLDDQTKNLYDDAHSKASKFYFERFDSDLYNAALVSGADTGEMVDAAMAICGSPWYSVSDELPLTEEVKAFLDLFKDKKRRQPTENGAEVEFYLAAIPV
jgi:hypothetical protein